MTRLVCLAAALWAAPGQATDRSRARFDQLYTESQEAFEARDLDRALALLQQAYELRAEPTLLFNMGIVEEAARRYPEALALYRRYLELTHDQEGRAAVQDRIDAVAAALDPAPVALAPEPAPVATAPEPAPVAPLTTQEPTERSSIDAVALSTSTDPGPWAIATTVAGSAALVAGVTLLISSEEQRSRFEDTVSGPGPVTGTTRVEALATDESVRQLSTAGIVLTAVGGAALATGIVLFAVDGEDDSLGVRATVNPLGGVVLGGTF